MHEWRARFESWQLTLEVRVEDRRRSSSTGASCRFADQSTLPAARHEAHGTGVDEDVDRRLPLGPRGRQGAWSWSGASIAGLVEKGELAFARSPPRHVPYLFPRLQHGTTVTCPNGTLARPSGSALQALDPRIDFVDRVGNIAVQPTGHHGGARAQ